MKDILDKYSKVISFSILVIFIIVQFSIICLTAVDIPFWDEWFVIDMMYDFNIFKVIEYHNEHRIFFSKLLYAIEFYITGLNFKYHSIINAVVLIAMVLVLYKTISLWAKDFKYLPLFFIPYFTTTIFAGYYQDMTSTHLMIIFSCIAIYFGFYKNRSYVNLLLMVLFLFLSIISFNFTFALGVMVAFVLKLVIDMIEKREKILKGIITLIIMSVLFFLIIYIPFFYSGKHLPANELLYPNDIKFWSYIFKSLVYSATLFSINSKFIFLTLIMAIILIVIITLPLFNKEERRSNRLWVIYALICGIAVSLSAIAFGRGTYATMIEDRHRAIMIILVPIVASILYYAIQKYKRTVFRWMMIVFSILIFISVASNLKYDKYSNSMLSKLQGVECVNNYYNGFGNGACFQLYPVNLSEQLVKAKSMNISFTR